MTFAPAFAKIIQNEKEGKRAPSFSAAEKRFMYVRYFSENDRETFLKLCEEFYSSHATMRPFDAAIAEKTFQRVVDHHENLWGYLIFEKEDEPAAGYGLLTTYWCNEEGGNVLLWDELYIAPPFRHKGYAKQFMEWMQEKFKKKVVSVTLEVLTGNERAISLYKEEGFDPDSDEKDKEGNEFVYYSKRLDGAGGEE